MADLKVQIEKLEGASNWSKWKWQMQMHFEQYELTSIVDGTRTCPAFPTSEADVENATKWRRDNAKASALIASTLNSSVADLVLTYTNAKEIWDKLLSVYEQSSIQRLNLLMTQFFQVHRDSGDSVATHAAKVERIFSDMNYELKRIGSSNIPIELMHGKILLTVGPEYQEFSNVWESLDSEKRTTNNLVEKLCTIEQRIKTSATSDYGAFAARTYKSKQTVVRNTLDEKIPSYNVGNQTVRNAATAVKKRKCFKCGGLGHLCKDCPKKQSYNKTLPQINDRGAVFTAIGDNTQSDIWICDSGASHHMTANKQYFETYERFQAPVQVTLADMRKIYAYGSGRINIDMCIDGKWCAAHMEDVWYVPDVRRHLFSIRQATKHNILVKMDNENAEFYRDGQLVAVGSWTAGMYVMLMRVVVPACPAEVGMATASETLQLWHERLAHQNKRHVRKVIQRINIDVDSAATVEFCDGCALGKAHRKPFKPRPFRAESMGEIINADVNGPMSVDSINGARYYVSFKDDYSKYRRIFFLRNKSEVSDCLRVFLNETATLGHVVKTFRCDGGREFDCSEVRKILAERGIVLCLSVPYTPEQNGAAERENRTVVELARSMLSVSELPKSMWAHACETAVYVLNRTGCSPEENKTPQELWTGRLMIGLDHLRVFGTICYAHIPKNFRKKFDNKSVPGHVVGYVNEKDGYQVYVPSLCKIIKSRDVYFRPERLCTSASVDIGGLSLGCSNKRDSPSNDMDGSVRRSQRNRDMPAWIKSGEYQMASAAIGKDAINPNTYSEALSSDESELWLEAMNEEMDALDENKTWDLVDRPKNAKVIDSRWVLKKKLGLDGTVQRYRARLVAKGYAQKAKIDYDETFSPVARYDTVRAVLAVSADEQLHLKQFDVKTAFLYGTLQEEVYMKQPDGFDDKSGRVCKLQKSLYGLKQAPRCWNQCFVDFIEKQGLIVSTADPCLFVRHRGKEKLIVVIYVDDGLVVGSNKTEVEEFLDQLRDAFKITTGSLDNFLGMKIEQHSNGIFVSQQAYTRRILERFGMADSNAVSTPYDRSGGGNATVLGGETPYQEAVGCLMYLMTATRPDIAYSVNCAARKMECPTEADWINVKRIFKYLRGTTDCGLFYKKKSDSTLKAYSDADFAGDLGTRRSTSGVLATYAGGVISWTSQLQRSVALSTTEAEFVAASEGAKELIWLKRLLNEITENLDERPVLYIDSASAVKLAKNPEFHKRSKHIEIRYYFVRECYIDGRLDVEHVNSERQLADLLTKPLDRVRFERLRVGLGLVGLGGSVNDKLT